MPDRYTESLFEIADVTGSTVAPNGEIRVNLGDAGTGAGIDADVPLLGSYGFSARPADPDAGGAAQAFFLRDGNVRRVIAIRDRRTLSSAGQREKKDVAIWTASGVRILLSDAAPSIEMVATQTPGSCKTTLGASSLDVTGASTSAEPVALYAALQASENANQAWIDQAQIALLAILPIVFPGVEIPPLGPISAPLIAAYAAAVLASTNATNPLLASSQVLKASPT